MNIGKTMFTKHVLDVLQLLTLKELRCAITRIIKQVTRQDLANIEGNQRYFCMRRAINLLVSSINSQHFPSTTRWL
jgi:hypothetical protein